MGVQLKPGLWLSFTQILSVLSRAAMIHFPTIRYIFRCKGHDMIHDMIHYCARQNWAPTTYTTFK